MQEIHLREGDPLPRNMTHAHSDGSPDSAEGEARVLLDEVVRLALILLVLLTLLAYSRNLLG